MGSEMCIRDRKNENEKGRAIIVITHDMKVALNAKRRYRLEEGVLREIT